MNRLHLFAAVAAVIIAVVLVLAAINGGSDATAQPPDFQDRLDAVDDELAAIRSELGDAYSELALARSELSGLRSDVAVLSGRVGRLTRTLRPAGSAPAEYTQAYVEAAIARYEGEGREAAVAYYNSPESVDGQWYLFIIDENDQIIAHGADSALLGLPSCDIKGPDGYPVGSVVSAAATAEGAWVDYMYVQPATGEVELKHSWAVRHDGLIFGSGWYEAGPSPRHEPGAYSQALVQRAAQLYDVLGRARALAYYNSPESVDGQWYVFILDAEGVRLAHPTVPEKVGQPIGGGAGVDVTGYDYGEAFLAVSGSAWVDYVFVNPAADNTADSAYERKHTWLVRHDDGLLFGSGWYERGAEVAVDPAAYTQVIVRNAVERYEAFGRAAVIAQYNTPQSVEGDWSVFIIDADGLLLADAGTPESVGLHISEAAADAACGRDLAAALGGATAQGAWVDGNIWAVQRDGLVFGSCWSEG